MLKLPSSCRLHPENELQYARSHDRGGISIQCHVIASNIIGTEIVPVSSFTDQRQDICFHTISFKQSTGCWPAKAMRMHVAASKSWR